MKKIFFIPIYSVDLAIGGFVGELSLRVEGKPPLTGFLIKYYSGCIQRTGSYLP